MSTESGIPDFRSVDGLYHQKFDYPPETILSHHFFYAHTDYFYRFYREKLLAPDVEPNAAHKTLARWEREREAARGRDAEHRRPAPEGGQPECFELHGSTLRNYCQSCGKFYDADYILHSDGVPHCTCGGLIKPDVVLYEEGLDQRTLRGAIEAIGAADVLIVGGTSLTVYPAAGLIDYYTGDKLVLINRDATPYDGQANLIFRDKIGEVLSAI